MDVALWIAISNTIALGLGAAAKFLLDSRKTAASIEAEQEQREDQRHRDMIAFLQAEVLRVSADRDKATAMLMENISLMNEAAREVQAKTRTIQAETSAPS